MFFQYSIFTLLTFSVFLLKRYRPHFYNCTECGDKCKVLYMSVFNIRVVPLFFSPFVKVGNQFYLLDFLTITSIWLQIVCKGKDNYLFKFYHACQLQKIVIRPYFKVL